MISFPCPSCSKKLRVKEEFSGKRARCPHCLSTILVPIAVSGDAAEDGSGRPVGNSPDELHLIGELATLAPSDPSPAGGDTHPSAGLKADERHLVDFLAPPQTSNELGRLGTYCILKILGHGGMGVVFEAEDLQLKRKVALKAMLPTLAASETARKRFLREAQTAAAIEHDHIVPIYQVGEDRGVPFIAMPLLKGEPLDRRLAREYRLPLSEVIRIGKETAAGLAAAHKQGLIHRDIKPGNLWLEENGRVKILDFGLARAASDSGQLTQSGAILGTPAFMAPEQVDGKTLDARCDLFSLGCVLYRLSTGELPFRGNDTISTLMAVATEKPRPPAEINPTLPHEFSALVMQLLAKKPTKRIPSAQALLEALTGMAERQAARTMSLPGASPWGSLRSANIQSPAKDRVYPRPPSPAKDRKWAGRAKRSAKRRQWILLGGAISGLVFLALVGLIVIRIATDNGELVIESDDPDIELVVTKGGKQVTIIDGKTKQKINLASGNYKIELSKSAEGLRLSTDRFVITRGGHEIVRVRRERAAGRQPSGSIKTPSPSGPSDDRSGGTAARMKQPFGDIKGFMPLFNGKDLSGWHVESGNSDQWTIEGGAIVGKSPSSKDRNYLLTDKDYENFTFRLQFMLEPEAIGAVAVRAIAGERIGRDNLTDHPFIGLIDPAKSKPPDITTGEAFWIQNGDDKYRQKGPTPILQLPTRTWHSLEITMQGDHCIAIINGIQVQDIHRDNRSSAKVVPALERIRGKVGFKSNNGTVRFRNIEIKELPGSHTDDDGFVPLFNGKDLAGWKTHKSQPGNWVVAKGILTGSGSPSYLYSECGDYQDFRLRVEARINDGGNSGVFFRTLYGPAVPAGNPRFPLGYEAQINSTHQDVHKTGSLYAAADGCVISLRKSPVPPGQWFTQEVIARGNHLIIKVNDTITADYRDDKRLFSKGHIALQVLTPQTVAEFRKIEIQELPPSNPESKPTAETGFVPLFNGRDLIGWKTHPNQPGNWQVKNGILVGSGPATSHLYTEKGTFQDFHLHVEGRINEGGNSGVYFRTGFGPSWPANKPTWPLGFEAQIFNSTNPKQPQTGSLYSGPEGAVGMVSESPAPVGKWFTMEVIAIGNHILIKINGNTTVDYTDTKGRFVRGHIALQTMDRPTVAEFRKIEIKELPPTGRK